MKLIKDNNLEGPTIITSETHSILEAVRNISPKMKMEIGGYKDKIPVEQETNKIKKLRADIISPHFSIITEDLITKAHSNGIDVHVWNVNDKETIQKMKNMVVDGITTDFPDRV